MCPSGDTSVREYLGTAVTGGRYFPPWNWPEISVNFAYYRVQQSPLFSTGNPTRGGVLQSGRVNSDWVYPVARKDGKETVTTVDIASGRTRTIGQKSLDSAMQPSYTILGKTGLLQLLSLTISGTEIIVIQNYSADSTLLRACSSRTSHPCQRVTHCQIPV